MIRGASPPPWTRPPQAGHLGSTQFSRDSGDTESSRAVPARAQQGTDRVHDLTGSRRSCPAPDVLSFRVRVGRAPPPVTHRHAGSPPAAGSGAHVPICAQAISSQVPPGGSPASPRVTPARQTPCDPVTTVLPSPGSLCASCGRRAQRTPSQAHSCSSPHLRVHRHLPIRAARAGPRLACGPAPPRPRGKQRPDWASGRRVGAGARAAPRLASP